MSAELVEDTLQGVVLYVGPGALAAIAALVLELVRRRRRRARRDG